MQWKMLTFQGKKHILYTYKTLPDIFFILHPYLTFLYYTFYIVLKPQIQK